MGSMVRFDKKKSGDLKELKRRQAEFDRVSQECDQHLNRFCLIGENMKGDSIPEKVVDDMIEWMGALSIASQAVEEQRVKMGLSARPKPDEGSGDYSDDGFLWRDHIEDDDSQENSIQENSIQENSVWGSSTHDNDSKDDGKSTCENDNGAGRGGRV